MHPIGCCNGQPRQAQKASQLCLRTIVLVASLQVHCIFLPRSPMLLVLLGLCTGYYAVQAALLCIADCIVSNGRRLYRHCLRTNNTDPSTIEVRGGVLLREDLCITNRLLMLSMVARSLLQTGPPCLCKERSPRKRDNCADYLS